MIVSDFIDAICETIEVEDTAACTPAKKFTHGYENGKIYMIIEKHTRKLIYWLYYSIIEGKMEGSRVVFPALS